MAGYTVPDCDCCQACCANDPAEITIDLGAGGWTSVDCDDCESINGEFTGTFAGPAQPARWLGPAPAVCDTVGDGSYTGDCDDIDWNCYVWCKRVKFAGGCVFYVYVGVYFFPCNDDDDCDYCGRTRAEYSVTVNDTLSDDCVQGELTLSKDLEVHQALDQGGAPCAGTLPATVTISGF